MRKAISSFFESIPDNRNLSLWILPLLITLVFAVYALVYATGGIKYVYSHSMYFPILVAGYLYGAGGGALIGLLGCILLGPFMPIDTITHEPQATINWLYRGVFFISIGMLSGYGASQLRNKMKEIHYLAHYDKGTGLPNRTSTIEYISKILRGSSKQGDKQHMLLRVSCDNLMEIEVAFGFDAADSIIGQIQQRLQKALPDSAFLSKTHRSEFAVVPGAISRLDADLLVNNLIEVLKPAYGYREIPLHVESTIGCAVLDKSDRDADRLLQMAELAVINARRTHQKAAIYDPANDLVSRENLSLLGQLREAIATEQLKLHYQPKVSLLEQVVIGAEALMRWQHPKRGMVPPAQFIPQAEQSSLIGELTEWALHSALAQQARWRKRDGKSTPKVAVNVSVYDLLAPSFSDVVMRALDLHKVASTDLELEVTENALMENIDTSISVLSRLSNANIIISIDDFGTGYSSLKYLDLLPATAIKIDQSFVFRLASDRGSRHIVQAAIGLAHALGMQVIAEGVENLETFRMLRDMGCDIAQGYFISQPLPHDQFSRFSFATV